MLKTSINLVVWAILILIVQGSIQSRIQINIEPKGKFVTGDYPEVIVKNHQTLYLTCDVKAEGEHVITWLHNGKDIEVPPPYTLPWKNGKLLYVRPVIKGKTDGVFQCSVQIGKLTRSEGVRLVVKDAVPSGFPKVILHPSDVHTKRKRVDFRCEVTGESPVQIKWFRNSLPVNYANGLHNVLPSIVKTSGNVQHHISNLVVADTALVRRGFYRCVASNDMGQVVSRQASIRFKDQFFRRRRRSYTSNDIWEGNCLGTTDISGFPNKLDVSSIRSHCYHHSTKGWYLNVQWKNPPGIQHFPATYYVLNFYSNCDNLQYCFMHNDTMNPSFVFDSSKKFKLDCEYEVIILPQPSKSEDTNAYTNLEICPPAATDPPATTSIVANFKNLHINTDTVGLLAPILGGVIGFFVLCLGISFFIIYQRKIEPSMIGLEKRPFVQVYISYAQFSKEEERRILKLAYCLNSCSIAVCMDLFEQVEISQMGGMPFWMHEKLDTSDKILVVLSPAYLKALQKIKETEMEFDDEICKINAEFSYVNNLLYKTKQRAPNLHVLLDGISVENVPEALRGKPHFYLPKKFSPEDESIQRLALVLYNTEPLRLENQIPTV